MDELDLTEKTPRTFDDDDEDDIPIHVAPLIPRPPSLSHARAARGTRTSMAVPEIAARPRRATTVPPPIPAGARRAATLQPPLFGTSSVAPSRLIAFLPPETVPTPRVEAPLPGSFPVVSPPQIAVPPPQLAVTPPPVRVTPPPPVPVMPQPSLEEHYLGSPSFAELGEEAPEYLDRSTPVARRNVAAIAGIAAGAALVVIMLGLGLRGGSGDKATASASPPPHPAPVAAPVAAPAATRPPPRVAPAPVVVAPTKPLAPPPAPVVVAAPRAELPITSAPSGAIVTLISDGDATIVGRTPLTAAVDPTRSYDVVVALRDYPTKVAHVDPSRTHELAIDLAPAPPPPRAAPKPARRRTTTTAAPAKPAPPKPAPQLAKPAAKRAR